MRHRDERCQTKWVVVPPEEFQRARDRSPRREFFSRLDELAAPAQCFLSEDRRSLGFALGADGEISSVFNMGRPGRGGEAVNAAIDRGGTKLNCFDTGLPAYYRDFGFREVGRVKFDRGLAPAEWNYVRYGTPDVVFMDFFGTL